MWQIFIILFSTLGFNCICAVRLQILDLYCQDLDKDVTGLWLSGIMLYLVTALIGFFIYILCYTILISMLQIIQTVQIFNCIDGSIWHVLLYPVNWMNICFLLNKSAAWKMILCQIKHYCSSDQCIGKWVIFFLPSHIRSWKWTGIKGPFIFSNNFCSNSKGTQKYY